MSSQTLAGLQRFMVKQKITMMVNRYEIRELGPNGEEGAILAMAQQKRMAFKEEVIFYADEARQLPVFSFKARSVMDLGATYDVKDGAGTPIGMFRKDFAKSLLRSTWHLEAAGIAAVGQETNMAIAIIRRIQDSIPLPFHFEFTDAAGHVVLSSVRKWGLRDKYIVEVPGARLDGRVAAAMAVGLDALQSR